MIVIGIFLSCENEAIPYYNSENDAVRFSNKNSDGKLFIRLQSFG